MPSADVELRWSGPYPFIPKPGETGVFDTPVGYLPGVYIWAIEHEGAYLVNYVGKAKGEMGARIRGSFNHSLTGKDKLIVDPLDFASGKRRIIAKPTVSDFLANDEYRDSVLEAYRCLFAFLAPFSGDDDVRQYIEAGLIRTLKDAVGNVNDFLCNRKHGKRSPFRFTVELKAGVTILGLGPVVYC